MLLVLFVSDLTALLLLGAWKLLGLSQKLLGFNEIVGLPRGKSTQTPCVSFYFGELDGQITTANFLQQC